MNSIGDIAGGRLSGTPVGDPASGRSKWRPRSSLLRFRSIVYLLALDCAAILTAFGTVSWARGFPGDTSWLVFTLALIPVYVMLAGNSQSYGPANLQKASVAVRKGATALCLSMTVLLLVVFFLRTSEVFPRLTIGLGAAFALLLLAAGRFFFVRNLGRIIGGNPFSCILILDQVEAGPPGQYSLIMPADSFFDPDLHDPMMYDRLARSLAGSDRVVIACPPERRAAWARALRGANIQGEISLPELGTLLPLGLGPNRDMPSVIVAVGPLNLIDRAIKRVFDVSVAGGALLLLSPLMLVVALLVKLDSPGPVLFKQMRIGRGNRLFPVLKFRSMRDGDQQGHRSTARDDDRITRVGRVIRRTSIDELPQLLNVLRGDMSIVGPRPHAVGSRAADKLFWEVDTRYWDRHATKPGLTGLAQVRGFRGATIVEDDLRNRLIADLEYMENWSVWRDVKILARTAGVLLHHNAF